MQRQRRIILTKPISRPTARTASSTTLNSAGVESNAKSVTGFQALGAYSDSESEPEDNPPPKDAELHAEPVGPSEQNNPSEIPRAHPSLEEILRPHISFNSEGISSVPQHVVTRFEMLLSRLEQLPIVSSSILSPQTKARLSDIRVETSARLFDLKKGALKLTYGISYLQAWEDAITLVESRLEVKGWMIEWDIGTESYCFRRENETRWSLNSPTDGENSPQQIESANNNEQSPLQQTHQDSETSKPSMHPDAPADDTPHVQQSNKQPAQPLEAKSTISITAAQFTTHRRIMLEREVPSSVVPEKRERPQSLSLPHKSAKLAKLMSQWKSAKAQISGESSKSYNSDEEYDPESLQAKKLYEWEMKEKKKLQFDESNPNFIPILNKKKKSST